MVDAQQVRRWLERDGMPVDVVEDSQTRWHFAVNYPGKDGLLTHILCPADRDHLVRIIRAVEVTDDHRRVIGGLSPQEFRVFRFNLVRDLLLHGEVEFVIDADDEARKIKRILLARVLREEGLSPESLFTALRVVHDAMILIILHVRMTANESL